MQSNKFLAAFLICLATSHSHRQRSRNTVGEGQEIWSRAVPSGTCRHMVDTQRAVPTNVLPSKGWMSERSHGRPFIVHNAGDDRRETGIINSWAPPPYHLSTWHVTRSTCTRPPPAVFHTGSDEIWHWEWPGN